MNRHFLFVVTAFILSVVIITGCKKDNDNGGSGGSAKTQLLTTSTWKVSTITLGGVDVTSNFEACALDDFMAFVSDGTATYDEGPTKCDSGDPQTTPFTWSFQSNETVLHLTVVYFGAGHDATITTLSETQMVLTYQVDVLGSPETTVATFIH